jgi:hypothetical protein
MWCAAPRGGECLLWCAAPRGGEGLLWATTPARQPELAALIRTCWQQRELRRPTAAEVHGALRRLLALADRCIQADQLRNP